MLVKARIDEALLAIRPAHQPTVGLIVGIADIFLANS